MSTLREIRKNLKKAGAQRKDIKMALSMMIRLEKLDRIIFPKNPATICFSIKKHRFGYYITHIISDKHTKERYYSIYLDGLADFFQEEKQKRFFWVSKNLKTKLIKYTSEELLLSIIAHEVRHRIQQDYSIKKFSNKSASLVKEKILKEVIIFNSFEFKERKKIYIREGKSKEFIEDRINPKEFDASIIENLVAIEIHRKNKNELREKIISAIKLQAP